VLRYLDYFKNDPKGHLVMGNWLRRSGRFRDLFEKTLREQGLPKDLFYVAMVESGFDTSARSRVGAGGIWQFMPGAARAYGVEVSYWVDARRDPERSADAAARYLKDLYVRFGSWPLALAAYNAGPGRIHRALDETGSTSFWNLMEMSAIPRETRGYVPTFFAAILIAGDAAAYGFRLADPVDLDVKRVEVEGPLSLRFIAQTASIDAAVLRDLNPALRHGIVPPGTTSIRVPSAAVAKIEARAATLKNEDRIVTVCAYKVRKGDTINKLARALGVERKTIRAMNGLSERAKLHRGESIYLPVRAHALSAGGM
jgi:membrane-bound lytic murein transglycosylase D